MTTTDRTPYCHKIRYGITGAPTLTENEMDGSHAPGVGVAPKLIELVYIPARDGKPARVDASVTGDWTRFGEPEGFGGQVTTHFKNGPDGWPGWLAEEARMHDPAAVPVVPAAVPPTTRTADRERIADALADADGWKWAPGYDKTQSPTYRNYLRQADAVLVVLPPPADRAAVLREAADAVAALDRRKLGIAADTIRDAWEEGRDAGADELRRMADEAQQAPCGRPASLAPPCSAGDHCCEGPAVEAQQQPDTETPGCPHCPDGHTPPTRGSQPWSAWVSCERDGDGQPMQITVARSAGAHVAESDAQWIRDVLNGRAVYADHLPLDHPLRRECRCSEAGVCRRCTERASAADQPAVVQPGKEA